MLWICNLTNTGTELLGAAQVQMNVVKYISSYKVDQMPLSQAVQSEAKEKMGLYFYQEVTALLVSAFATMMLIYHSHTHASIFIASEWDGERRRGRVWVWSGGIYRLLLYAMVYEAY